MPQSRLYFVADRGPAYAAYAALETALEDEGYPLAIVEIDEEAAIFEVSAYCEDGADALRDRISAIVTSQGLDASVAIEELPDIDWVTHTLEALTPVRAGRFLVHGAHDRGKRRINDIAIEIEAGLAFGTGHHGTTAGCLAMIAEVLRSERPRNALDLGTGSAVLAIAVAKMARIPVLATDIDPIAVDVARDNVRLNEAQAYVRCETAPGFHHASFALSKPFDLIVANILARPLMRLAPQMARHIAAGGSLILSGILDRQRDAVVAAYVGQRFRHVRTTHREGWVTIHLKR